MKTVIGRKILKEASKGMEKNYKEAVQIARKFKAAKKDDWNKPEYMELMEKFLKIRQQRDVKQRIINTMIQIENFLPTRTKKEKPRITNPRSEDE